MGTWEPSTSSGGSGKWRAQILTEDQTGKNPNEVRRFVLSLFFSGVSSD